MMSATADRLEGGGFEQEPGIKMVSLCSFCPSRADMLSVGIDVWADMRADNNRG